MGLVEKWKTVRLKCDAVWAVPNMVNVMWMKWLWSVKWIRWKWMSCTMVHEVNRWTYTLNDESASLKIDESASLKIAVGYHLWNVTRSITSFTADITSFTAGNYTQKHSSTGDVWRLF